VLNQHIKSTRLHQASFLDVLPLPHLRPHLVQVEEFFDMITGQAQGCVTDFILAYELATRLGAVDSAYSIQELPPSYKSIFTLSTIWLSKE